LHWIAANPEINIEHWPTMKEIDLKTAQALVWSILYHQIWQPGTVDKNEPGTKNPRQAWGFS
jgi:hypothetical protein